MENPTMTVVFKGEIEPIIYNEVTECHGGLKDYWILTYADNSQEIVNGELLYCSL